MGKLKPPVRSDNEIRQIVLRYFYERNRNARSARSDKTGVAAKISVVYRELKASRQLSQPEIRRNLTYLLSEKWVEEEKVTKNVPLKGGTVVPQETSYFKITAAGIDKIEGPGEFTMPKFQGIKIEATGQNIITVGDGNTVDARFSTLSSALADLRHAVIGSNDVTESEKLSAAADIDTIQAQLAKSQPSKSVIKAVWSGIEKIAIAAGLVESVTTVTALLLPLVK